MLAIKATTPAAQIAIITRRSQYITAQCVCLPAALTLHCLHRDARGAIHLPCKFYFSRQLSALSHSPTPRMQEHHKDCARLVFEIFSCKSSRIKMVEINLNISFLIVLLHCALYEYIRISQRTHRAYFISIKQIFPKICNNKKSTSIDLSLIVPHWTIPINSRVSTYLLNLSKVSSNPKTHHIVSSTSFIRARSIF